MSEPEGTATTTPAGRPGQVRMPIAWLIAAIGLTVVVIGAVAILAGRRLSAAEHTSPATGPLVVGAVDQPGATGRYCSTLMAALPAELSGLPERTLADPTPGVKAWGDPAVVVRCGIPDPQELTCSAALYQINDVAWLVLTDDTGSADGSTTFIAVDRPVRVAVTVTGGGGSAPRTGPIQAISDIVAAHLPSREVCSSDAPIPPDNG